MKNDNDDKFLDNDTKAKLIILFVLLIFLFIIISPYMPKEFFDAIKNLFLSNKNTVKIIIEY